MAETILMQREDFEQMMTDIVTKVVSKALKENAAESTELDEFYTVKELARKWRVSVQCIWRHVKLGHITPVRVGKRVLFPKDVINSIGNLRYSRKRDNSPIIIK